MKRWKVNQNLFSNTLKSKTTAKTKKFCLDGAEPSGVGRKVGRIRPDQVAWQPEGNKTSLSGQTCFHGELDCQLQHFEFGHIFEQIGPKSNSGKKSGADDGEKLVFSATLVELGAFFYLTAAFSGIIKNFLDSSHGPIISNRLRRHRAIVPTIGLEENCTKKEVERKRGIGTL